MSEKCKNCKHRVIQAFEGSRIWNHYEYSKDLVDVKCFCGCNKPEPKAV